MDTGFTLYGYYSRINDTITKEKVNIEETDQSRRNQFHAASRPNLQEGFKATAISAAIEGGMSFCLGVARKLKSGKKLSAFTEQD